MGNTKKGVFKGNISENQQQNHKLMKKSIRYYEFGRTASLDISHSGLQLIKKAAKKAKEILDVGCGEGTKLDKIAPYSCLAYGIDSSKLAIKLAKKTYPTHKYLKADAEKIPFNQNYFDLVYSTFSLEHLLQPEEVIMEMIRVCKPKGKIIFLAPNFGAPNRASPCYKKSRVKKLIRGFVNDFLFWKNNLIWEKVKPIDTKENYRMDYDTAVEPYLLTLERFLKNKKIKIIKLTSFWEIKQENEPTHQRLFKILGLLKIFPFSYWGPHLYLEALK